MHCINVLNVTDQRLIVFLSSQLFRFIKWFCYLVLEMSRKGFFISKRKTVLLIQKSKKFRRKEIKKKEIAATITETWRDQKNIVDQVDTEISNSELRMKAANEIINNFHKKHKVWFFEKFLRKKVETQKQKVETQQDSVLYSLF